MHGLVEVKTVLIDVTMGSGQRETVLALIAGDQMTIIENKGREAPAWLKQAALVKLKEEVEQG